MSSSASSLDVTRLLASYPHVVTCDPCREYAAEYVEAHPASIVLAAVLNHHDTAHVDDRLNPRVAIF